NDASNRIDALRWQSVVALIAPPSASAAGARPTHDTYPTVIVDGQEVILPTAAFPPKLASDPRQAPSVIDLKHPDGPAPRDQPFIQPPRVGVQVVAGFSVCDFRRQPHDADAVADMKFAPRFAHGRTSRPARPRAGRRSSPVPGGGD